MERDFMGLGSNIKSESNDSAPYRASAMQWSFSNKVSAVPQLLSFKATEDDGSKRTGFDSLTSTGFMTISSAEAFDSNHKPYSSIMQNVIDSAVNPQPLVGVPVISSVPAVLRSTSIVGSTDLRNPSKSSRGPAQLTIFYAGSVCVYDDVSPEKVQAIMLLAGNGNSATISKTVHTTQVEAPVPKPSGVDSFIGNQFRTTCAGLGFRSPVPVTLCAAPPSAGGFSGIKNISAGRAIGTLPSTSHNSETSKAVSMQGSVSAILYPSAVPQIRKASLARFLEKRKERATSASPYVTKQSPDSSATGSDSKSFSMNTGASYPLPASN